MNKPTKTQLSSAVNHCVTGLDEILSNQFHDVEDLLEKVRNLRSTVPSLEPQPKAVAEVLEETADVVDPEAPAVA